MKTHTDTITVDGVTTDVTFTWTPAYRAPRDRYGAPEAPDEDESIDIESVKFGDVELVDWINDETREKLVAEIRKNRSEQ